MNDSKTTNRERIDLLVRCGSALFALLAIPYLVSRDLSATPDLELAVRFVAMLAFMGATALFLDPSVFRPTSATHQQKKKADEHGARCLDEFQHLPYRYFITYSVRHSGGSSSGWTAYAQSAPISTPSDVFGIQDFLAEKLAKSSPKLRDIRLTVQSWTRFEDPAPTKPGEKSVPEFAV